MENDSFVLKQVEEYSINLKLAQAVNYLFKGKYKPADALLIELTSNYGENPTILNLYASSLAQQGRLPEAESVWKKALIIQPDNLHFQGAVNKIHDILKKRSGGIGNVSVWLKNTFPVILFLLIVLAGYKIFDLAQKVDDIAAIGKDISNKISAVKEDSPNVHNEQIDGITKLLNSNVSGITVDQTNSTATIKFNEGLFYKGAILQDDSKGILTNLAKILEKFKGTVNILGCTDDLPVTQNDKYSNNLSLAAERAETVYKFLTHSANLSSNKIYLGSLFVNQSPYSNSSIDNKLKNRTVVIKLSHEANNR